MTKSVPVVKKKFDRRAFAALSKNFAQHEDLGCYLDEVLDQLDGSKTEAKGAARLCKKAKLYTETARDVLDKIEAALKAAAAFNKDIVAKETRLKQAVNAMEKDRPAQDEHLATTRQGTCNMINGMLAAAKSLTTVFCIQQRMGPAASPTDELIAVRRTFEDAASFIARREGRDAISWTHHDSHGRSWTWGDYCITEQELS